MLAFVATVRRGERPTRVEPVPEALAFARATRRRGVPLSLVLRTYHLGLGYFLQAWQDRLARTEPAQRARRRHPAPRGDHVRIPRRSRPTSDARNTSASASGGCKARRPCGQRRSGRSSPPKRPTSTPPAGRSPTSCAAITPASYSGARAKHPGFRSSRLPPPRSPPRSDLRGRCCWAWARDECGPGWARPAA